MYEDVLVIFLKFFFNFVITKYFIEFKMFEKLQVLDREHNSINNIKLITKICYQTIINNIVKIKYFSFVKF